MCFKSQYPEHWKWANVDRRGTKAPERISIKLGIYNYMALRQCGWSPRTLSEHLHYTSAGAHPAPVVPFWRFIRHMTWFRASKCISTAAHLQGQISQNTKFRERIDVFNPKSQITITIKICRSLAVTESLVQRWTWVQICWTQSDPTHCVIDETQPNPILYIFNTQPNPTQSDRNR